MNKEKVKPFDSFLPVYKVLTLAGYFKLLKKPHSRLKHICYTSYRFMAFIAAIVYNLQHIAFIIQRRDHMDDVFDALMIEIPHINLVVKLLTLNLQIPKINKVHKLLNDPIFAADTKMDQDLILNNTIRLYRLYKYIFIGLTIATLLWPMTYFMRRHQDSSALVPSYLPFATDTWGTFSLSVLIEVIPFLWIGHGHIAMDCLIATYYAQAEVQLKIIKYNLKHLFDTKSVGAKALFQYSDKSCTYMKRQFVYYVQRYEKVAWYTKEVNRIFNPAVSFQYFSSTISLCVVACRMSSIPAASVSFIFLVFLLIIFSTQVFLYCYFGNAVQYESESVVTSLYLSDWLSIPPQFRRLLLIAMLRWSRALTPTISRIAPLSLPTFLSFYRSAYSLYAVFSTRKL